jgi:hypothetical protein
MATCPDCGGYLDETHVCGGRFRRRRRKTLVMSAAVGGILGAILPFLLPGFHQSVLSLPVTTALGCLVAVAFARALLK